MTQDGPPCTPPKTSAATSLFESDYILYALGRANELGYPSGALLAWLGGRGGQPSGEARAFRARGDVGIAGNRLAVDKLAVTLDRENADGRFAYTWPTAGHPAVFEADLHATKLDLDALTAFARTAVGQNGFELPRQGSLMEWPIPLLEGYRFFPCSGTGAPGIVSMNLATLESRS